MKNKFIKISAVFLTVLIILSSFLIPQVSAAEVLPDDIETSDVLSDLKAMGIDCTNYKKDVAAEHCRMLKFLEFGYDYNGNQSEYGLYIYVWNPTGKALNDSVMNKISIQSRSVSNVEQSAWRKLPLEIVDYSTATGYEHVFYKLRLSKSAAKYLLQNVSRDLRVYEISELELHHSGNTNAESYTIGGRFTFTGFQPYHNSLKNAVNTLHCNVTDRTTIDIKINPTTWKTYTSAKGVGYANELFSVYFAIPNDIIRDYGNEEDCITKGLVQIDGTYDRHSINGLVVNDSSIYEKIYPHLGITVYNTSVPFQFCEDNHSHSTGIMSSNCYVNPYNIYLGNSVTSQICSSGSRAGDEIEILTSVLQADISSLDDYISALDLKEALYSIWNDKGFLYYDKYFNDVNSSSGFFGDDLLYSVTSKDSNGKYVDIADQIKVYAQGNKKSLWDSLFGNSLYDESSYENIKSIQVIDPKTYTADMIGFKPEYVSDKYYVSERDVEALGSFVDKSALYNKTTYLMRFAVEDYYATEVGVSGDYGNNPWSCDAIYFEKVIYQNVDILTFTFENKYGGRVVLPVAATPVDNVGEITPTLKPDGSGITNSDGIDKDGPNWDDWRFIILLLAGIAFIVLLNWLCNLLGFKLSGVFKFIISLIAWPFKLIGKLFVFGDAVATSSRKAEEHKWKRQEHKLIKPKKEKVKFENIDSSSNNESVEEDKSE